MLWWEGGCREWSCLAFLGLFSSPMYTDDQHPRRPPANQWHFTEEDNHHGTWGNRGTDRYSDFCELRLVTKWVTWIQLPWIQLWCFSCWKSRLAADTPKRILLRLINLESSHEIKLWSACVTPSSFTDLHKTTPIYGCQTIQHTSRPWLSKVSKHVWALWFDLSWLWCSLSTF